MANATADAIDKMKSKITTLKDAIKGLRTSVIDNLKRIQDRFWGLSDEEASALQQTIDYNKEKMDTMKYNHEGMVAWNQADLLEYVKYEREVSAAEKRIREIKMKREVTPVSKVESWANTTREFLEKKITGITGGNLPTLMYPRLQPVTMTPSQAVNTFNFHFEGAFIGAPDEFSKKVIDKINRESEMQQLGGK